jgi:hypothetical protein
MPKARKTQQPRWVTVASCDVGERALACWIGRLNLSNPLEFETLDWWVIDVYPSYWKKNARNTPLQTANRFFYDRVKQRFSAQWIKDEVQCVIIESQFRPNKRMYALSHCFNTNIWHLMPNACTGFVSSANKTRFIKKHAPELMMEKPDYDALSADRQKKHRKEVSIQFARRIEPLLNKIEFRKMDDCADTLNQALGSTNTIAKLLKTNANCRPTIPPAAPRQRKWLNEAVLDGDRGLKTADAVLVVDDLSGDLVLVLARKKRKSSDVDARDAGAAAAADDDDAVQPRKKTAVVLPAASE